MALTSANFRPTINAQFATDWANDQPELKAIQTSLQAGTAANQADLLYVAARSATTGGDSIDLSGGGLLQLDGSAFNPVDIVGVGIVNKGSAGITVGGGSNPVANISLYVGPQGWAATQCPTDPAMPVTAGTGDILKVTAASGTQSYIIFILGRSA